MQFLTKDLKFFLKSTQNNNIKQIQLKSNQLEITINRQNYINNKIKNIDHENYLKRNHKFKTIQKKIKQSHKNEIQIKPLINVNLDQHESKVYSTIISPMVGTFYQSPAPNESPFIKKGDFVDKKQVVCIIEAMKLMNEIEAEVKGEVVEILVNDGDIVDCGQALMKVKLQ